MGFVRLVRRVVPKEGLVAIFTLSVVTAQMCTEREDQEYELGRERLVKRLINPGYKEKATREGQGGG